MEWRQNRCWVLEEEGYGCIYECGIVACLFNLIVKWCHSLEFSQNDLRKSFTSLNNLVISKIQYSTCLLGRWVWSSRWCDYCGWTNKLFLGKVVHVQFNSVLEKNRISNKGSSIAYITLLFLHKIFQDCDTS